MENKFKVRCTKSNSCDFTVGNIYEWKDGKLSDNSRCDRIRWCENEDVSKWIHKELYTFEKVTEPYEFKVGDRVNTEYGKGTIKYKCNFETPIPYAVEHDEPIDGGHECNGSIKCGYGRYYSAEQMTLIPKESPAKHNEKIVITNDGHITTAKLYDNKNLISTAKAICAPTDTFDFATGAKLALDRLYKSSEVREVKRPAKVGEWIKVVNAECTSDCYKNGDKLIVDEVDSAGVYAKTAKTHPSCHMSKHQHHSYIANREYVVLENYTPPVEPSKREYKAGDLARVVGNSCRHNFPLNTIIRLSNGFDSTGCNAELLDKSDRWSVHYADIEPFDGRVE